MRLQVLLLLVVSAAILHAYPQRQLDRKRSVSEQSAVVSSRGGRKYQANSELVTDAEGWRSERTQRRVPTRELASRDSTISRRADYHAIEPEPASSVWSPVTQQLISPRRTQPPPPEESHRSLRHNSQEEPTESPRRRPDTSRRSRTRAEVSTTESSRRSRTGTGSRREPTSSTEISRRTGGRRTGSRGVDVSSTRSRSTESTTTQTPSTSEVPLELTSKATAPVETKEEVASSDTPNTKSHTEESSNENTKETSSQSEEVVSARKKEVFSHAEESSGTKRKESSHAEEILSTRRSEISSHIVENTGIRKKEVFNQDEGLAERRTNPEGHLSSRRKESSNHPQETTSIRRKESFGHSEETIDFRRKSPDESAGIRRIDSSEHTEDSSGGRRGSRNGRKFEPSTQTFRSRNSGSRSEDTAASPANTREYRRQHLNDDSARLSAGDSHVDVPRVTARHRTTTVGTGQDDTSRRSPTRGSRRGDTEVQRNGQFQSKTASDGEPAPQRSYQRSFARRGEVSTTGRVTTPSTREVNTSTRRNFRSSNFERPKTAASLKKKNVQVMSSSEEQETLKVQRDSEEVQDTQVGGSSAEDSFITRSSHQVVTVTAYPYSKDQNRPSNVGKRESFRGRTKASESFQRTNRVESRSEISTVDSSSDVNKIRPRTANLLLAPSPPSSSAENNVEEAQRSKLSVVGGYSRLRDAANNEDNNLVSTATPFTRVTPRRENKVLPTTARGKSRDRTYQKELAPTTELQRQVPTPSSPLPTPNPTISHSGKTGYKQRFSSTSENYPPNFPVSRGRTSTSRKPVDATTEPTVSTSRKFKSFKESSVRTTTGFRRSVGSGTEDNRISSSTTEVSIVTSQSVQSNIPRFSSRYRSDLLRATGHGLRGTTTPVYVPTVPTVRPTVSTTTTEPAFSAIGKMAADRGFTRSEVHSHWTNQL